MTDLANLLVADAKVNVTSGAIDIFVNDAFKQESDLATVSSTYFYLLLANNELQCSLLSYSQVIELNEHDHHHC